MMGYKWSLGKIESSTGILFGNIILWGTLKFTFIKVVKNSLEQLLES